jgi:transcriptional regulator with XRE-family HTH domain
MTFQKRLKRIMKRRGWRVADLARELGEPYTTVREWVLHGRIPANISSVGNDVVRLESQP